MEKRMSGAGRSLWQQRDESGKASLFYAWGGGQHVDSGGGQGREPFERLSIAILILTTSSCKRLSSERMRKRVKLERRKESV